jgi:ApbE superfamily uncharacterized protein (UPF0280 family)
MLHVSPEVVHVAPPGWEVTVYKVIAAPPLELGAVQEIVAEVVEATTALGAVGAPGAVAGTIAAEAGEDAEVPAALVAVTENV